MANDGFEFQLEDIRLISVHFDINQSFKEGKDVHMAINLTMQHEFPKPDLLRLIVSVDVKGEDAPISINASIGSLFRFKTKPDSVEEISKIAEIHGAAITFPFLREVIADITRRAGLPPLMLQPINFVEFYKNNHPDTSELVQ